MSAFFNPSLHKGSVCFVYVVCKVDEHGQLCAPVKVGIANDISKRIRQLKTSCPFKIQLFSGYIAPRRDIALFLEQRFHEGHKYDRLHGEWFNLHPAAAATSMMHNMIALFRQEYGLAPEFVERMLRRSVDNEEFVDAFKEHCGDAWEQVLLPELPVGFKGRLPS